MSGYIGLVVKFLFLNLIPFLQLKSLKRKTFRPVIIQRIEQYILGHKYSTLESRDIILRRALCTIKNIERLSGWRFEGKWLGVEGVILGIKRGQVGMENITSQVRERRRVKYQKYTLDFGGIHTKHKDDKGLFWRYFIKIENSGYHTELS